MISFVKEKKMQLALQRTRKLSRAVTLIEVIVAMAIVVVIITAIIPQLRAIRNSWASARDSSELIQTGQAIIDHITRELSQAIQITFVSGPSETNGSIEFINNDGNTVRYDIAASNYVEFGQPGSLVEIGGPVSGLRFVCYDAYDFITPITDVNSIRFVETAVTVTDPTGTIDDKTFTAGVYIRTNVADGGGGGDPNTLIVGTSYWNGDGACELAISRIDQNHYLLAYGPSRAVVLTVNPDTGLVSPNASYLSPDRRATPALCKIDDTHHLRVYEFGVQQGGASVLTVSPATWTVTEEAHHEFDGYGKWAALCRIDSTHYLCVYYSTGTDGHAVVLTVDPADWSVSHGTALEFDNRETEHATLVRIDESHYLCVYRGFQNKCTALVLTVDTGTWTVTAETPLVIEKINWGRTPLCRIDSTHFLCTYYFVTGGIRAVVFTIDPATWSVSATAPYEVSADSSLPSLVALDTNNYVCTYNRSGRGYVIPVRVASGSYAISKGNESEITTYDWERPCALARIDDTRLLCVSKDSVNDLYGVVISRGGEQIRP